MASQVYEFHVEMTCGGCAGAITNVLNKKEDVTNLTFEETHSVYWFIGANDIQIDLKGKKVFVTSTLSSDEILQTIKKTGLACHFLGVKN